MIEFEIDKNKVTPFPHYWEMCVGSSNAYTALREDYRKQLKRAHDELGFKYVRFHGILDDRMSVLIDKKDHSGNSLGKVYNFVNIDNIFDWLLDHGMKPFIELGFMPTVLARGDRTVFHYKGNICPPKDYSEWEELIKLLTEHLIERYGIDEVRKWFFEVWNEPNLFFFFDGDKEEYFNLYASTAKTIKSIDADLQVGGPATSCNSWIKDTVEFCSNNGVPLDFISTHHYPTDDPLWESGMDIMEFFQSGLADNRVYHRGVLQKMTKEVRKEAGDLPVYFTEWNTSAMTNDAQHDEPYAASMVAKTLVDNDGLVDGYAFWTFSDIFEESGQLPGAFHGGFGLQTYSGVAKPVYRTFELFHGLGQERMDVVCNKKDSTVEMIGTITDEGYRFIIYNHNIPGESIKNEHVCIPISHLNVSRTGKLWRIDDNHANAKEVWVEEGSPEYPSRALIEKLHEASELEVEDIEFDQILEFDVPSHGLICIDLVSK